MYRCRWRTVFQAILAVCTGVLHLTQQWTCRLFKGKTNGHRVDDGFSLNGHSAFIVVFNKTSKKSYTCTRLVSGWWVKLNLALLFNIWFYLIWYFRCTQKQECSKADLHPLRFVTSLSKCVQIASINPDKVPLGANVLVSSSDNASYRGNSISDKTFKVALIP